MNVALEQSNHDPFLAKACHRHLVLVASGLRGSVRVRVEGYTYHLPFYILTNSFERRIRPEFLLKPFCHCFHPRMRTQLGIKILSF